ncbi:cytoplasmic protein [Methylobacter tundripaludum]|uniref:cytoplasmic protein n=1 Tax=Methylobacter tundripaludum TaxID=173365 RepID=UPI000A9F1478|nr:cytoplasmic protein [Methylobacter tundripaludum]
MISTRCIACKNYFGDLSCQAFEQIPEEILTDKNDHSEPLADQDNDIVFELLDAHD